MKKFALTLSAIAGLLLTNLQAATWDGLTSGWSRQSLTYDIHHPHDLEESARFQKVSVSAGTEYRFEIRQNDAPFQAGSTTQPRTEMRVRGQDYAGSGSYQFEADVKVPDTDPDTTNVIIFQVKQTEQTPVNVYTTLRIIGTNLCVDEEPIRSISRNTWYHINVVHASGSIKIYVNGTYEKTVTVSSSENAYTKYFKCGTYNMSRGVVGTNKIVYRNIKIWKK